MIQLLLVLIHFAIRLVKKTRAIISADQMQNLKPIATWSLALSRASSRLQVLTLSSHWLMMMSNVILIGSCDCLGFGFWTLNLKLPV